MTLTVTNPRCLGDNGSVSLDFENNKGKLYYSIDEENFTAYRDELKLPAGDYYLSVMQNLVVSQFEFSIMPDEEISFDFINIEPANCNGQGGRIQAALTGSGTMQMPTTGSGTIIFNSRNFGPEIDVEVDAGRYTLTAFLTEDIQMDTSIFVTQETCDVYIPNAFNPESNEGLNKRFIPGFPTDTNPIVQTYTIYDRWGSLIYKRSNFEANQFTEWWDGTCIGGERCERGVYVYKITVAFETGDPIDRTGSITLF